MLELLAAALRRDTEEPKLWHSLPHGSRSRACDLRKRRARGDGCGRGGVSRAHSSVTPLAPESLQCSGAGWGRGGGLLLAHRKAACLRESQAGGLPGTMPWGQQPPTQTQDSAVPGVIRPCQCVTEPVQPRHGHRGVRTGFEMPRLGGETHPSVPSCAPHPRGFTVAVCLVARPLSARGHVPAASTWRWPEP